jgi:hypothetical protein
MRTIKFRGKTTKGAWLYGDLEHRVDDGTKITYIFDDVLSQGGAVLPETVGQFTGLKDKNDNEIYEDDVIECGSRRYVCEFIEGGFEFRDLSDGELILKAIVIHSHVIGNIHDNPELRLK